MIKCFSTGLNSSDFNNKLIDKNSLNIPMHNKKRKCLKQFNLTDGLYFRFYKKSAMRVCVVVD